MKKLKYIAIALLSGALTFSGCSDSFLDREPTDSLPETTVVKDVESLNTILEGVHCMIYTYWHGYQDLTRGLPALNVLTDLLSDDFVNTKPAFYMGFHRWTDAINPYGTMPYRYWDCYYTLIQHLNTIIARSSELKDVDQTMLNDILGQSYTLRALCYSRLIQLYAHRYDPATNATNLGVVLRTEPGFEVLPRATVAEVYEQIDKDIKQGLSMLNEGFVNRKDKSEVNIEVAYGIAARIALSEYKYDKAEEFASKAIEISLKKGRKLQSGKNLADGFNNLDATEWIWGYRANSLQDYGYSSFWNAFSYNFDTGFNRGFIFAINRGLFDKMGAKDARRAWWVCTDLGDTFPEDFCPGMFGRENTGHGIKFKSQAAKKAAGDYIMMRMGEMYYIKSEAQAQQGKIAEAVATLNEVMITRDPDYSYSGTDKDEVIDEIMRNKRLDMWMEGEAFFDMKRQCRIPNFESVKNFDYITNPIDRENAIKRNLHSGNMSSVPTNAESIHWQFAIPYDEIKASEGRIVQNPLAE